MRKTNIFSGITKKELASLPFAEKLEKISKLKQEQLHEIIYNQRMRLIGELMGGFAHQLNNKFIGVVGFADILLNKIDKNNENYNHIKMIKNAGESCQEELLQLSSFSQKHELFSFTTKTAFVRIDIKNILDNSIRMIANHLKFKKIRLEKSYTENFTTLGVPILLEQAFINMLLSGVCDTKSAGIMRVECSESNKNKHIVVTITSNIAKERKLSDKFSNVIESKESMGLPISYCIIKIHGGMMNMEETSEERIVLRAFIPLLS